MTNLPEFRTIRPASIDEAVAALVAMPSAVPLAGATDLLPNLRRGLGKPEALVDMTAIAGLAAIEETAGGLRVGAAVTLATLAADSRVQKSFPVVVTAALAVAGPTHRAAGTVGGNLCQDTRCMFYNQSEWWRKSNSFCLKYQGEQCHVAPRTKICFATYRGDLAPALMVLGAEAELAGPNGRRTVAVAELFRDDGADHLTLAAGEMVVAVILKGNERLRAGYAKLRIRDSIDFPLVGVAAAVERDGNRFASLRVAVTGSNPAPLVVPTDGLIGQEWTEASRKILATQLKKTAKLQNTTSVGMQYRRRVLLATAERLVDGLWGQ